jgi:hypothetical protein
MMNGFSRTIGATVVMAACTTGVVAMASAPNGATVTEAQVRAAHAAWGEALVQISTDFAEGGIDQAKATAITAIDTAYGYNLGPVLFKPTLTQAPQTFRTTAEGALAYFVGQDPDFPEDKGFALNGWTEVAFEDAALFISGATAMWMGNVHITDASGAVTTVDKTFGYQLDEAGDLRIVLHHSSLPFSAD